MMTHTPFKIKLRTLNDVDNAARFLSEVWNTTTFAPAPKADGKKKNALRHMVCKLAGYQNGLKSFMAELERLKVPAPTQSFDLPSDIYLNFDADMEYLYLGKGTGGLDYRNGHANDLGFEHENFIDALYANEDFCCDVPANFDADTLHEESLRDKELWRYIVKHYEVKLFQVYIPRIDKYGPTDLCETEEAIDYLRNIGLTFSGDPYDQHHIEDTGDDSSQTLAIWLRKKEQ